MASRRLTPSSGAAAAGAAGSASPVNAPVIVALTDAGGEGTAPAAEDLFIHAELLGWEADALAARDPLPGVTEIRQVLREVPTAEHALRLSDHDLVLLAAAASASAAATPRLELYPRNLPAERAVKISQVGSIAEGAFADELVRRVLARFPDLDEPNRPTPDTITEALKNLGYDVVRGSDSRLHLWPSTQASGTSGSRSRTPARLIPSTATAEAAEHAAARLTQARQRGGFIALKAPIRDAVAIRHTVAALDGVTGVNVTTEFVRTLRAVVAERGRPKWETVLAADSPDASPYRQERSRRTPGERPGPALRSTYVPSATAVSFSCTTPRPSHGTWAAPSCSRSSKWPPGTRTNRRLACGCSAPWRTRSPRRNSTG